MTKIMRWLVKKFLPGYHLAKDPAKGAGRKKNAPKNPMEVVNNNHT